MALFITNLYLYFYTSNQYNMLNFLKFKIEKFHYFIERSYFIYTEAQEQLIYNSASISSNSIIWAVTKITRLDNSFSL